MSGFHDQGPAAAFALQRPMDAVPDGSIDELWAGLDVALLTVFGSAAYAGSRATARDLDIGVSFRSHPQELALISGLTRLLGFDRIDLAVVDDASPLLRSEALCGAGLYEHDDGALAAAQLAAVAERYDTAWLRRLDLERLAEGAR